MQRQLYTNGSGRVVTLRTLSTQEPVRLGLLLNPRARFNRHHDLRTEATRLLGAGRVIETRSLDELPSALATLFNEQRVNVLGICGGDGTMHHTINALLRSFLPALEDTACETLALPPLLTLRGGTLNMLTRNLRAAYDPSTAIRRFYDRYKGAQLGSLLLRRQRLLQIDVGDEGVAEAHVHPPHWGFIFGTDLTARCLDIYDNQFDGGYRGLARFLGAVGKAFVFKNAMWQKHRYLFEGQPPHATITPTGSAPTSMAYRALVAATIDIELLGGWICGLRASHGRAGSMSVRVLEEQSSRQIMTQLHKLVLGHEGKGILDFDAAESVRLECGEYSLDGEVLEMPQGVATLGISVPKWTLPFVSLAS